MSGSREAAAGSFFGGPLARRRWMFRFVYMYFLRFGFLDGLTGLRFCLFMAAYEQQTSLKGGCSTGPARFRASRSRRPCDGGTYLRAPLHLSAARIAGHRCGACQSTLFRLSLPRHTVAPRPAADVGRSRRNVRYTRDAACEPAALELGNGISLGERHVPPPGPGTHGSHRSPGFCLSAAAPDPSLPA